MTELEMVARIALAAGLGAVLGLERELQNKTAGLRTHTLVAAGAALFSVAGSSVAGEGTDLTRVAAQVVTGIGFIGAGGMIRTGFTISGVTTAATLWFSAALGVASGFGLYVVATLSLALALVAMIGFAPLSGLMRGRNVRLLAMEYRVGHGTLTPLFQSLNAYGARVHRMSIDETEGKRTLNCEIIGLGTETLREVVNSLRARPEVIAVSTSTD